MGYPGRVDGHTEDHANEQRNGEWDESGNLTELNLGEAEGQLIALSGSQPGKEKLKP